MSRVEILVASLVLLTIGNFGLLVYAVMTARRAREVAESLVRRQ